MAKTDPTSRHDSAKPPVKGGTVPQKGTGGAVASSKSDIQNFLQKASKITPADGRAGLVFAMDATMSRQHTWDEAQHIQAQMFDAVDATVGLDIQLVYFRGFGECRASRFVDNAADLRDLMTQIDCRGGRTQIGKVLAHTRKESAARSKSKTASSKVSALVYVGDAMEEDLDLLCDKAGELGLLGVPCFVFQEGHDAVAEQAFREIARLSNGAFMRFGPGSASKLAELLKAVARFAGGGRRALEASGSREDRLLLEQMK
ncbi:MAG: VWA domain-containing protein [Pseudomonadota bacterium]